MPSLRAGRNTFALLHTIAPKTIRHIGHGSCNENTCMIIDCRLRSSGLIIIYGIDLVKETLSLAAED